MKNKNKIKYSGQYLTEYCKFFIFLIILILIPPIVYSQTTPTGNTPPPQITIGTVAISGDNYVISYTPHDAADSDGDVLSYIFTWTGGAAPLTFTDVDHTGEFPIAATNFKGHTPYVVSGQSFDTKDNTDAANTVSFTTPNRVPDPSSFITISRVCDSYFVNYTPHDEADADNDPLVYLFTFSNANGFSKIFTDPNHSGSLAIPANLLPPHISLDVTGKTFDGFDYVDFSNTGTIFTPNSPPTQITLGTVSKIGDNYEISYSPHPDSDSDNDILTFSVTIAATGFSKTFTDTNHTGLFTIAADEFSAHTGYLVAGKSYDGIDYTDASNSISFSTPNTPPALPEILSPKPGTTAVAANRQIRFEYSIQAVDPDGDPVESKLYLTGPGLDTVLVLSNVQDYTVLPQSRFRSDETYLAKIDSRDGFDVVEGNAVTFKTPNTSGISQADCISAWSVYPVPSTDHIFIRTDQAVPKFTEGEIIDTEGRTVRRFRMQSSAGTADQRIDVSALMPGIYFVRLKSDAAFKAGSEFRKIIKSGL